MIKNIEGLNSREFEHPLDTQALELLEKTPGLDILVKKFHEFGVEKLMRFEFLASNLKVTHETFEDVYETFEDACETLNLEKVPDLYFRWDDYFRTLGFTTNNLQGITIGAVNPLVAISIESIENFSKPELLFIMGSEIGRIKSQRVLYEDIARLIPVFGNAISAATFGIGNVISAPILAGIDITLAQWLRMADYSADRAGLLACQDIKSALTAMAKIAGLPKIYFDSFKIEYFIQQARELDSFADNRYDQFLKTISLMYRDQAFTIARTKQLLDWVDQGNYQKVLDRETKIEVPPPPKFCPHCGSELEISYNFCGDCGKKIS